MQSDMYYAMNAQGSQSAPSLVSVFLPSSFFHFLGGCFWVWYADLDGMALFP
jgi:hypothetical protein